MNLRQCLTFTCSLLLATFTFAQSPELTASPATDMAILSFDEPTFEYGTIHQGEIVENVFELENTGTKPLVITQAKGSCGCTVPRWPKDPIMPGEKAEILVQFDSKGKIGKQSKRVTLWANTEPEMTYLTIKGNVYAPEDETVAAHELPSVIVKPINDAVQTKVDKINSPKFQNIGKSGNARVDSKDFVVFPNPTSDQLMVRLKNHFGKAARIDVFNNMGQLMTSQVTDKVSGEAMSFDVSEYANGTYTVTVKVDGMIRVAKRITVAH